MTEKEENESFIKVGEIRGQKQNGAQEDKYQQRTTSHVYAILKILCKIIMCKANMCVLVKTVCMETTVFYIHVADEGKQNIASSFS
jgi:hypothetical protein